MSISSTDVSDGDGAIGKLTADVDAVVITVNEPVVVATDSVLQSQSPSNPSDTQSTRAQLNQMAEILSNEVDAKLMNPASRGDVVATRGAPTVASIDGPSSSEEKAPNLKNMSDAEVCLPIYLYIYLHVCLSICLCDSICLCYLRHRLTCTIRYISTVSPSLSLLLCLCRFTSTLTSKPQRSNRLG